MDLFLRLIIAGMCLALFSFSFDSWVGNQEERGRHEGFVSLYVVAGVLAVLAGAAFVILPLGEVALTALVVVLVCFCAAGIPMIYGSVTRHLDAREREQSRMHTEAHNSFTEEE